ncbi:MAG TPA: hypothetical protein VLH79_05055 [Chthonomonadales bacterium]|nr:hypothetical protein [Chthonomonadales bacterium]
MVAGLVVVGIASTGGAPPMPANEPVIVDGQRFGRHVDRTASWRQAGGDLLHGFVNMYHLSIVRDPADRAYPYRGWFFGWADDVCNTRIGHGCDMIFAARAPRITGPWEVYRGGGRWDATMNPRLWEPVLVAQNRMYDAWHNGDPSVVRLGRRWYMAYSATGHNRDGIPFGRPGDTDSDLNCVMGAVSDDGIRWTRSRAPILMDPANVGAPPMRPGEYLHARGVYHRPSLRREGSVWRLWFDTFTGSDMPMVVAENRGDFLNPDDWRIVRGPDRPALANFPNPDVVRIDDVYFAYGDPGGYEPLVPSDPALAAKMDRAWASRKIMEAISLNGLDWAPLGYLERDADAQANHVPAATAMREGRAHWIYLTYGAQQWGGYFYDRIRMKRRQVTAADLRTYRKLWRTLFPTARP